MESPKTVFDHIKHIKESKTSDYYSKLSEGDQKTFNKYVILTGLSMDQNTIEGISSICKYIDVLPPKAFYQLCCDVTPQTYKYSRWVKSSKMKVSKKLMEIVASYYKISRADAHEYCMTFFKNETSLQSLINLCSSMGYEERQIEKMLEGKDE